MRLAMVVTPFSNDNLKLAAQVGVIDIVGRYPGPDLADLQRLRERVESVGLRLGVIEGYLPMDHIKRGDAEREREIDAIAQLVRNMGRCGVPVLCYNFMTGSDWTRTSYSIPQRGGALVSGFDIDACPPSDPAASDMPSAEQLWENLGFFLDRIVPVAEEAGVALAMHPDDPPLPTFQGFTRIMTDVAAFDRLVEMHPSPANGVCFCQGTFKSMGVDVLQAIKHLAPHIRFVHFRDVEGSGPKFRETFHDNGSTDMVAAMRTYRDIGFSGPIRPDHVPTLAGEEAGEPGYTMLGRLYAAGYMRGLMQAVATA